MLFFANRLFNDLLLLLALALLTGRRLLGNRSALTVASSDCLKVRTLHLSLPIEGHCVICQAQRAHPQR